MIFFKLGVQESRWNLRLFARCLLHNGRRVRFARHIVGDRIQEECEQNSIAQQIVMEN